jgi:8-oxo-dGTP pyrophosphatase MutT (NUDIX family)
MPQPSLIQSLKLLLSNEIPGSLAHKEMMAKPVGGGSFRFDLKGNPKPSAVLICLYQRGDNWFFPLIQRPDYNGTHGGQVSLPGGKKEEIDNDLTATALRETEEEIGLVRSKIQVLGALSSLLVGASNHQVLPVIGYFEGNPVFVPDQVEVAEVIEARLSDILDAKYKKEKETIIRGFPLITPYFELNGAFVWGATAMILNELATLMKNTDVHKIDTDK